MSQPFAKILIPLTEIVSRHMLPMHGRKQRSTQLRSATGFPPKLSFLLPRVQIRLNLPDAYEAVCLNCRATNSFKDVR